MKKQIVEIDINQLDEEELRKLEKIFYDHNEMLKCKQVGDREMDITR